MAILDVGLPKVTGFEVAEKLIRRDRDHSISVILLCDLPDKARFVDEVVTGQVQFLTPPDTEKKLPHCLARALNRVSLDDRSSYRLRFLAAGETLFQEGEVATSVFIVKTGELEALRTTNEELVPIGRVHVGEFVGEMAHINNDNRSATIRAVSACELIEIPRGTLDMILFSKPAWAKALIATLSKRLKVTSDHLVTKF